jgi:hypothetical protein
MSKKQIFEIPDDPGSVVFQPGREISLDGKTMVEVDLASACSRHLMTDGARAYCEKHRFNPVFVYSTGNLPVLIGFVFDEKSFHSFSPVLCTPSIHGEPRNISLFPVSR